MTQSMARARMTTADNHYAIMHRLDAVHQLQLSQATANQLQAFNNTLSYALRGSSNRRLLSVVLHNVRGEVEAVKILCKSVDDTTTAISKTGLSAISDMLSHEDKPSLLTMSNTVFDLSQSSQKSVCIGSRWQ
jgi:hypothetical protein